MTKATRRFLRATELIGLGRPSVSLHERRARLRSAVAGKHAFILPGVHDVLGARLVERAGFAAAYLTGAGLANAQYGLPDLGLISLSELTEHASRLSSATEIPLIADADTGFGGALAAMRTARMLESAGVAGIQIEDQENPKRCGHFDSHVVIATSQMEAKIAAVVEAREDENLVVIARTDARSAEGLGAALARARAYRKAGADAVFVEAPQTVEELRIVGQELEGIPLVVNVVEGGKTPQLSRSEYESLGFRIVLHANFLMRAMLFAGREALTHLAESGETSSYEERIATWSYRQDLVNLPAFEEAQAFYDVPWDVQR